MQHFKTMLACVAATLLFSCTKKEEEKKTPVTPSTDKLIGSWETIAIKADRPVYHWNTTELVTDLWDRETECHKDNLLIFKAGTFSVDEGATKCLASAPQVIDAGTWTQSGNTLTVMEDGKSYTYTIDKLDDNTLITTGQSYYIINGDTTFFNATITRRRK